MEEKTGSFGEKFLDNIWLLFILGGVIYFVSYIIWGWYQIGQVPDMPAELKNGIK